MALRTHGKSGTRIYRIWAGVVQRCTNPRNTRSADYMGRGIKLCRAWRDFASFYADVGDPPSAAHSLDRIRNSQGYKPGNVRWATDVEQANNSRRAVKIRHNGKTLSINEWCREIGLAYVTFKKRRQRGWDLKKAATTPPNAAHRSKFKKEED